MHPARFRWRCWHVAALWVIACRLALAQFAKAEEWADGRVAGPFVCRADFSLGAMNGLFGDLRQLQEDLARWLGIPPPREPIELYLFRDQRSYRQFVSRRFPQVPYRRALYVKMDGPGMVFAHCGDQFEIDVRHECTHALVHAALPMVPLWLDEGIAEYFELAPAKRAFDNPYLSGVRWAARFGMLTRINSLEKKAEMSEMSGSDYRAAWAWVHFMLHGPPEAHEELVRYLADIRGNVPPGMLSQRLQRRLPGLERRFTIHFSAWKR